MPHHLRVIAVAALAAMAALRGPAAAEEGAPTPPPATPAPGDPLVRGAAWARAGEADRGATGAWLVGNRFCVAFRERVVLFDASTGEEKARIETGSELRGGCYPAEEPGRMLFCDGDAVSEVDVESGKVLRRTLFPVDPRIAPVGFAGDFVAVKGYRGGQLVRVEPSGREAWKVALPGYVMVHPSRHGGLLVVQTRQGSYGGQATTGVDLSEGTIRWSDTVDAYGCGAAFARDGAILVEGDMWLSPSKREGRLIGRCPATGRRLWLHACPELLDQPPVVRTETNQVFAVFEGGTVKSLAAEDGTVLWEVRLPRPPYDGAGDSYEAGWPALALHGGLLLVLDQAHFLHVLDASGGTRVGSIDTLAAIGGGTRPRLWEHLKARTLPSVAGDRLLAATNLGFAAYALSERFLEEARRGGEPFECACRRLSASAGGADGLLLSLELAPGVAAGEGRLPLAWTLRYEGTREFVTLLEPGLGRPAPGRTVAIVVAEGGDGRAREVALAPPPAARPLPSPAAAFVRIPRGGTAGGILELDLAGVKARLRREHPGVYGETPPRLAVQLLFEPADRGSEHDLDAWTGTLRSEALRVPLEKW